MIMGASYLNYFDQLLPGLMRYMKPTRMHSDRSMAIGCFAEVIERIGSSAVKYVGMGYVCSIFVNIKIKLSILETLLPIIEEGLRDNMESIRRNSAYCLGQLHTERL
jgi:hypothetical protein